MHSTSRLPVLTALNGEVLRVDIDSSGNLTVLLSVENFKLERGTWSLALETWTRWERLGPRSD